MLRAALADRASGITTMRGTDRVDFMKRIVLGLLAATAMSLPAFAADIQPALLYDLGGKFDKSFNEAAYNGAEKFKAETGVAYVEFEVSNASQREQALRRFAEDGRNPIVMAGFSWVESLQKVAAEYPELIYFDNQAPTDDDRAALVAKLAQA